MLYIKNGKRTASAGGTLKDTIVASDSHSSEEKNVRVCFLDCFSLCLSRACLGKTVVLKIKMAQKCAFFLPFAASAVAACASISVSSLPAAAAAAAEPLLRAPSVSQCSVLSSFSHPALSSSILRKDKSPLFEPANWAATGLYRLLTGSRLVYIAC
jgi:hypothetical protein